MNKEILRMQMLAGLITESEYKANLKEETDSEYLKRETERYTQEVTSNPELSDEEKKSRLDDIKFVLYNFLDPNTSGGERPPSNFQFDDEWWSSIKPDINEYVVQDFLKDLSGAANGTTSFKNGWDPSWD
jgi:hypothetical protein